MEHILHTICKTKKYVSWSIPMIRNSHIITYFIIFNFDFYYLIIIIIITI